MASIPKGYYPRPPAEYMIRLKVFELDKANDFSQTVQSIALCILDHNLSLQQIETELRNAGCNVHLFARKGGQRPYELEFLEAEKTPLIKDRKANFKLLGQLQDQVVADLQKKREDFALLSLNPQLKWAEEVGRETALQPLSDFDAELDDFLKNQLGEKLFSTNVAKSIIQGVKFTFIADRHTVAEFRSLVPSLIAKVNEKPKVALS